MADTAPVEFLYANYRGELRKRRATPIAVHFGPSEWHPDPQWVMRAFDHDKQAERDFALADCNFALDRQTHFERAVLEAQEQIAKVRKSITGEAS